MALQPLETKTDIFKLKLNLKTNLESYLESRKKDSEHLISSLFFNKKLTNTVMDICDEVVFKLDNISTIGDLIALLQLSVDEVQQARAKHQMYKIIEIEKPFFFLINTETFIGLKVGEFEKTIHDCIKIYFPAHIARYWVKNPSFWHY